MTCTDPTTSRGFTVPEMLCVVAICVIILATLMPSLNQGRKHAMTAACASNVRQLTMSWRSFAADTGGRFVESWQSNGGTSTGVGTHWYVVLRSYYNRDLNLLLCPSARLRMIGPGNGGNYATSAFAWKVGTPSVHRGITTEDYGSYGLNNWLEDPTVIGTGTGGARPNDWFINRFSAAGGHSDVPVLGDGCWPDQGWPLASDLMPTSTIDPMSTPTAGYMKRFALDRHIESVNLSYLDCSVRTVKVKNLWAHKWHKAFVTKAEMP